MRHPLGQNNISDDLSLNEFTSIFTHVAKINIRLILLVLAEFWPILAASWSVLAIWFEISRHY